MVFFLGRKGNELLHFPRPELIFMIKDLTVHGYFHIIHLHSSKCSLPDLLLHRKQREKRKTAVPLQHLDDKGCITDFQNRGQAAAAGGQVLVQCLAVIGIFLC